MLMCLSKVLRFLREILSFYIYFFNSWIQAFYTNINNSNNNNVQENMIQGLEFPRFGSNTNSPSSSVSSHHRHHHHHHHQDEGEEDHEIVMVGATIQRRQLVIAKKIIAEMSFSPSQEQQQQQRRRQQQRNQRRKREEVEGPRITFGERIDGSEGSRQDSYELLKDKNGFCWWHDTSLLSNEG